MRASTGDACPAVAVGQLVAVLVLLGGCASADAVDDAGAGGLDASHARPSATGDGGEGDAARPLESGVSVDAAPMADARSGDMACDVLVRELTTLEESAYCERDSDCARTGSCDNRVRFAVRVADLPEVERLEQQHAGCWFGADGQIPGVECRAGRCALYWTEDPRRPDSPISPGCCNCDAGAAWQDADGG